MEKEWIIEKELAMEKRTDNLKNSDDEEEKRRGRVKMKSEE
jgi:hypothetical protein